MKYTKDKRMTYKQLTSIVVWTEIYSVIKGHCQAYSQNGKRLTLEQYLLLSKNFYYGQLEKKAIYEIFEHYEDWKRRSAFKLYDKMDLVNHILWETESQFFYDIPGSFGFLNQA